METRISVASYEEFWAFEQQSENLAFTYELHNGTVVEVPSPSPLHNLIVAKLLYFLMDYLTRNNIGYAFGDNTDFALNETTVFKPDVSFVAAAKLPSLPAKLIFSPDIAVEVMSPSNTAAELLYKVETYLLSGTQRVWVIYPELRSVYVYQLEGDESVNQKRLSETDALTADDILPGFSVLIHELFPTLPLEE